MSTWRVELVHRARSLEDGVLVLCTKMRVHGRALRRNLVGRPLVLRLASPHRQHAKLRHVQLRVHDAAEAKGRRRHNNK